MAIPAPPDLQTTITCAFAGSGSGEHRWVSFGERRGLARHFHSVVGNRTVELAVEGVEPVECDFIIPVNIIPQIPEEAVAHALEQFRRRKADREQPQAAPAQTDKPAEGPAPGE